MMFVHVHNSANGFSARFYSSSFLFLCQGHIITCDCKTQSIITAVAKDIPSLAFIIFEKVRAKLKWFILWLFGSNLPIKPFKCGVFLYIRILNNLIVSFCKGIFQVVLLLYPRCLFNLSLSIVMQLRSLIISFFSVSLILCF